jgi:hypothetical protein
MDQLAVSDVLKANKNYSYFFKNIRSMCNKNYFSQAGQDLFVLAMLNNKRKGYYLEIGGADPFDSNNSFLLESAFDWSGLSVEFDQNLASRYGKLRNNVCVCADATSFDYINQMKLLEFPSQIDYLSVDIDPAANTLVALMRCPFETYRFSVITFEHDTYSSGDKYANLSRKFLIERGYVLVSKNVKCFGRVFEDWWIDPTIVKESIWLPYKCEDVEFSTILDK